MTARFRIVLLLLLFLVLPIQGMASIVSAFACPGHDETQQAAVQVHSHDAGGTAHTHPDETSGPAADGHSGHLCCHHFSSAALPTFVGAAQAFPPVFASSLSLLESLFIPELPQRPPRG